MIEVKNIRKKFIKNIKKKERVTFYADDDISFNTNDGEIIGILGPNGAGKTTLLRIIAGIMEPTSGEVIIDDMNYKNDSLKIKERICFLTGNTKLYKDISSVELLEMFGDYYGVPKKILHERINKIIDRFDMKSFKDQRIGDLSTGQNQRVAIARCLVHDPKYYIFDEPTSGLDVLSSRVILDFVKEEKRRGKTILYSTHYMEEAENICDRVILIHQGKIIMEGTVKYILKQTKTNNLRDAFLSITGDNYEME